MTAEQGTLPVSIPGRPRRFLRTFGLQTLDLALRVLLQILSVPILIGHWGAPVYQDWIVIFAAAGFLLVLDCGMQTYFVNSLLVAHIHHDRQAYRRLISVAMTSYALVLTVVVVVSLAAFASGFSPAVLGVHKLDNAASTWTAVLLGGAILSLLPLGVFTGIYRIRGNYDLSVVTGLLSQTAPGFGLCLAVYLGGSPVAAAMVYFSAALAAWLFVATDQLRRYGEFPLELAKPARSEVVKVVAHSLQYMVSGVASPVTLQGPVLLLGFWGAASSVVPYVTTRTLTGLVRQLVTQSSQPVGVELARLHGLGDKEGVRRLFRDAIQLASGVAGLLCGYLLTIAAAVLQLWTHGQVSYDPWLFLIFAATVVSITPAQIALSFLFSTNQPRPLVVSTTYFTILAIALSAVLIGHYAAEGAALAIGLAEILCIGLFVPYVVCKRTGIAIASYAGVGIGYGVAGLALGYGISRLLGEFVAVGSLGSLIGMSLLWTACVAPPAYFLLLTRDMRRHLKQVIAARLPWLS